MGSEMCIRDREDIDPMAIGFKYINWIEPEKKETITSYAQRMAAGISESSGGITLIGHSLGGIITQEISTLVNIDKIILISSIKSRKELPFHFKTIKPLGLQRLFSKGLTQKTIKYWGKAHGYESLKEQALVKDMVGGQSNAYLQWALRQLSIWEAPKVPSSTKIFQVHGDADKTFPIKLISKPDRVVENAGHFMVYKRADMITKVIIEELGK